MVRLLAYFDASGHSDDPLALAVAGFVSTESDWNAFEPQWRKRLAADRLQHLHLRELNGSLLTCQEHNHCSDHWTEARRRRLVADLIRLIQATAYRKFGSIVLIKPFSVVPASRREKERLTAFSLAGRDCGGQFMDYLRKEWVHAPMSAEMIFEDGDRHKGILKERFAMDGLPAPTFEPKRDRFNKKTGVIETGAVPLQAAELLTYCLFDMARKVESNMFTAERADYVQLKSILGQPRIHTARDIKQLQEKIGSIRHSVSVLNEISRNRNRARPKK